MERSPNKARVVVRLIDVHKDYRSGWRRRVQPVLRGVDLQLDAGTVTGLAGPNGSGKSTLLRLVSGLELPTSGTVEVLGARPTDVAVRTRLGYLGEESPYPSELAARPALDLLAALSGIPRAERRELVPAVLERVGLADERHKRLARFSRGMLRRFGLAQAFLHEPEVVLLDEPTAGLDAPGYPLLFELVREARERGACVMLSSHLMSDLAHACDRLAVLVGGRLSGGGPPNEVAPAGLGALYTALGSGDGR